MGKKAYLAVRRDQEAMGLIFCDLRELTVAAKKLANQAISLGGLGFGTAFLEWVASFSAVKNILTGLLIPHIFVSLPLIIFNFFRGEVGKWIAFIAAILRIFFPRRFPDWLEMPAALILLIVVEPSLFAGTLE